MMPGFQVNEVMLTIEEVREIAQMLRFPSHFEASTARRMGLRLDARASHAEEQNATRKRLMEAYPVSRDYCECCDPDVVRCQNRA